LRPESDALDVFARRGDSHTTTASAATKKQLIIAAFLLTACTTAVRVRGPYAASLSHTDIQQIRRVAVTSPHFGHTIITLDALQRDRVLVQSREYQDSGWSGIRMYAIRRQARWQVDEHSPISGETERRITVY
jgi:hypothetical protein